MTCDFAITEPTCDYAFDAFACDFAVDALECDYSFGNIVTYLLTEDAAIIFDEQGNPLEVE